MSTDYSDIWDLGMESDCCGAGVYLNGICSNCNDHCTPVDQEERELMDEYRDKGMSPGNFFRQE